MNSEGKSNRSAFRSCMGKFPAYAKKNKSTLFNYLLVSVILVVFGTLAKTGNLTQSSFITPNMLTQIAYTMILVLSLNLVVGFLGELSLGHAGFMYVGAYAAGLFSHYTKDIFTSGILRLILAMLVGGIAAALFGLIIGLPALRLRGDYLAIVTLAFGEIVRGIIKNIKIPGFINLPANGFTLKRGEKYDGTLFIVAFVVVLITLFCIRNLSDSKHGRAIKAIRDNEIAARAMGINITFYKLMVFAIAAFFAGIAGALYSNYSVVTYTSFSYNYSIEILVMVVLGGMGSLTGSLLSSMLLVFINVKLQANLTGDLAGAKYLVYALILIVMMIINASPKLAPLRAKLNWKYLWSRIRKKSVDVAAEPALNAEPEVGGSDCEPNGDAAADPVEDNAGDGQTENTGGTPDSAQKEDSDNAGL